MTKRQLALARAIERLSGRDMHEVTAILLPGNSYGVEKERWELQQRLLDYAASALQGAADV